MDQLSSKELGERLRQGRDAADITQADASTAINVARTTIVAIEKGQRRVRATELRQLAKLYGVTVNTLLRLEAVHVDLIPKFRKLAVDPGEGVADATRILTRLIMAEVELENLLGIRRVFHYPPERPVPTRNVQAQAALDAQELRQRMGLGLRPVQDMVAFLELEVGARVFIRRLDAKISGLFVFDDAFGACILLNANHPRGRRNQTAAHELAHLVSTRREVEVLEVLPSMNSADERYADAFAHAFLTPERTVVQKFEEITAGSQRLTRRHIIVLAHCFGVSREAIVRRLEELELVRIGTWDWFEANGRITDEQAIKVLGDRQPLDGHKADADAPTTLHLSALASEAWRQGLLSEGQLADLLDISRVELRELVDEFESEGGAPDEARTLPE